MSLLAPRGRIAAVGAAAEHDAVRPAVAVDGVSGVTQQTALPERNARFTPRLHRRQHAVELRPAPVLVVADAEGTPCTFRPVRASSMSLLEQ